MNAVQRMQAAKERQARYDENKKSAASSEKARVARLTSANASFFEDKAIECFQNLVVETKEK